MLKQWRGVAHACTKVKEVIVQRLSVGFHSDPLLRHCALPMAQKKGHLASEESHWGKPPRKTGSSPEAVLESSRHILQVAHPSSSGGLSTLSLFAPVVRPDLGRRVSAWCASCWMKNWNQTIRQSNIWERTHFCVACGRRGFHNACKACATLCVSYCVIKRWEVIRELGQGNC